MANTTKMTRAVKAAEDKISAEAEKVRADLANLSSTLPALREQVSDIEDGLSAEEEVMASIRAGEDVADGALTCARERDERARIVLKARENRLKVLEKSLPAPSTLLADKIAPAFQQVVPGVEVITTIAPLKSWRNDVPENATAVVLCVDPKVERDRYRQTLSGIVHAYYIRSGLMRPISVASLEAAHRMGKPTCAMEVTSNVIGDEGGWVTLAGTTTGNQSDPNALVLDTLTIRVDGALDGLPIIPRVEVTSSLVKTWAMAVFSGFTKPGQITTARVIDVSDISDREAFVLTYGMGSTARCIKPRVSEDIDGKVRTLTMKHTINLSNVDPAAFATELSDGAQGYVGGSYLGLGVLSTVDATPRRHGTVLAGNNVVDVVTVFESKVA